MALPSDPFPQARGWFQLADTYETRHAARELGPNVQTAELAVAQPSELGYCPVSPGAGGGLSEFQISAAISQDPSAC